MKKSYESPKAEKMAFQYSDVVVASGVTCINRTTYSLSNKEGEYCKTVEEYHWEGPNGQ